MYCAQCMCVYTGVHVVLAGACLYVCVYGVCVVCILCVYLCAYTFGPKGASTAMKRKKGNKKRGLSFGKTQ